MNTHKHTEYIFFEILALKATNSSLSAQMGFRRNRHKANQCSFKYDRMPYASTALDEAIKCANIS